MESVFGYLEIFMYIFLLPFLPMIESFDYYIYNEYREKKKYIPYSFWENVLPTFFSAGYIALVFVWPHYIGDWPAAGASVQFLTTILQFLLPLQITAAIARNRHGIGGFRAFTTKMRQLKWILGDNVQEDTFMYIGKAMKWNFRGGAKPSEVGMGTEKTPQPNIPDKMLNKLFENAKEEKDTGKKNAALSVLNEAMAAYSEMKNLSEYKIPTLFISFFYLCMTAYFFLLPHTFIEDEEWTRVFKCCINLYVFLGMFNISVFISHPFRTSTVAFQTVGSIEKAYGKEMKLYPVVTKNRVPSLQLNFKLKV